MLKLNFYFVIAQMFLNFMTMPTKNETLSFNSNIKISFNKVAENDKEKDNALNAIFHDVFSK